MTNKNIVIAGDSVAIPANAEGSVIASDSAAIPANAE